MLIPELQKFHGLFTQIVILHQKLINIWSRDTLICERGLGTLTPTPPGVEFWRTKIRFYYAGHRKNEKTTTTRFAGCSLCNVKLKILKTIRILAGLLDNNEPAANQGDQHKLVLR